MSNDLIKGKGNGLPEHISVDKQDIYQLPDKRSRFWDGLARFVHALKPKFIFFFRRKKTKPDGTTDEIEIHCGGRS